MKIHLRIQAFLLALLLFTSGISTGYAATLGPATTYDELRSLLSSAEARDTILVSGTLTADSDKPVTTNAGVRIKSADGETAVISGMSLDNASVTFSNIAFSDSLSISGSSHIQLTSDVTVIGGNHKDGLSFHGNGTLIIDPGCRITGGAESSGVSITHTGGEFYSSVEGSVQGGSGHTGGAGVVVSPLSASGAILISGSVQGGEGTAHGGHALNLYGLNGNAFVTIDGDLRGGSGPIGGDGVQLVAAKDNAYVGIGGAIRGGHGEDYGGDAFVLMNAEGASSFQLSGAFTGGDASGADAQPGTSLQLVGNSASARTQVLDCILEDGKANAAVPSAEPDSPDVTPLPEITSSPDDVATPSEPEYVPMPEISPTPSVSPVPTPAPQASAAPSAAPENTPDAPPQNTPESIPDVPPASESTVPPDTAVPPADEPENPSADEGDLPAPGKEATSSEAG